LKKLATLLLFSFVISASAQMSEDSLWTVFNNKSEVDSNRIDAIHNLTRGVYAFTNPDTAKIVGRTGLEFCISIKNKEGQASLYNDIGIVHYVLGDIDSVLHYFTKSLHLYVEIEDLQGEAGGLNNIGNIHYRLADYPLALDYYHKSLKIKTDLEDKKGIASTSTNIGAIQLIQYNLEDAEKNLTRALLLYQELDDSYGLSSTHNNLGNVAKEKLDYQGAFDHFLISVQLDREMNDLNGLSGSLISLGTVEFELQKFDSAFVHFKESYQLSRDLSSPHLIASSSYGYGLTLTALGMPLLAKPFCDTALLYATELNDPQEKKHACRCLSEAYEGLGELKQALHYQKLFKNYNDSVLTDDRVRSITNQAALFNFEIQTAAEQAIHDREVEVENVKHALELDQEKAQKIVLAIGIGILILISIVVARSYILKKRDNRIILAQKKEVELQKDIVDEKNREITDSIRYAKRLQEAILPPARVVKEYLDNSFILYKPKDIVAGDFYWMETKGDLILIAAADCTGHGVPGAMVSVVCSNALHKAVNEDKLLEPGEILDSARKQVVQRFNRETDEVKDGMDIALCSLNTKTNELKYAGANNPLWILRKGGAEMEEIKASKQPVGMSDHTNPFITHSTILNESDTFYLFSDGYADQFGGDKGKKMKTRSFKELLLSLHDQPMDVQKSRIDDAFEVWKGDLEQIDDVCVIGVRV